MTLHGRFEDGNNAGGVAGAAYYTRISRWPINRGRVARSFSSCKLATRDEIAVGRASAGQRKYISSAERERGASVRIFMFDQLPREVVSRALHALVPRRAF